MHTFRGEGSEASWLLRIGYREFLNTRRKKKTREVHQHHHHNGDDDDAAAIDPDATRRTSRIAEGDVRRALRVLSDDERAAIAACFYDGLTHDEAAAALDMPLGTLKSHVARAREKLRGPLASYAPPSTAGATP